MTPSNSPPPSFSNKSPAAGVLLRAGVASLATAANSALSGVHCPHVKTSTEKHDLASTSAGGHALLSSYRGAHPQSAPHIRARCTAAHAVVLSLHWSCCQASCRPTHHHTRHSRHGTVHGISLLLRPCSAAAWGRPPHGSAWWQVPNLKYLIHLWAERVGYDMNTDPPSEKVLSKAAIQARSHRGTAWLTAWKA